MLKYIMEEGEFLQPSAESVDRACGILDICKLEPKSQVLLVADLLSDFGSRNVTGLTHLT